MFQERRVRFAFLLRPVQGQQTTRVLQLRAYLLPSRVGVRPQLEVPGPEPPSFVHGQWPVSTVVVPDPVDMVNLLGREQRAAKDFFDFYAVLALGGITEALRDHPVAVGTEPLSSWAVG
ncbi:hypothetical protein [Streptomyces bobili]|uniref:Uncharacterized protein n=1 Tax=Streptomyces bobili TaxID=67280 RepID=A0ABZ1QQ45_9ACTN|nr:hypothetical protein [Streptomyces bobili]